MGDFANERHKVGFNLTLGGSCRRSFPHRTRFASCGGGPPSGVTRPRLVLCDHSFWVAGSGGVAEFQGGLVDFVEFEKLVGFFGHFASEENEKASCEGVQCASMADFDFVAKFGLQAAANFGDDAEARNAGWFIY